MQIFHLNLFFAGQDFSTPYMADDLDLPFIEQVLRHDWYFVILDVSTMGHGQGQSCAQNYWDKIC